MGQEFPNGLFDKELVSKIYKELIKLTQKPNNPVKKWVEDTNTQFCKKDIQKANRQMKLFNITHHQGNTNQNHDEIPPHTCQNG